MKTLNALQHHGMPIENFISVTSKSILSLTNELIKFKRLALIVFLTLFGFFAKAQCNTSASSSVAACDSYTWFANGTTYTASGTYVFTSLNSPGCVHTETLNLTINSSSTSTSSATACDSYTWSCNGQTYTTSGIYTCTSINATGCVHTEILNLTINVSTTTTSSASACDAYTWSCNGSTYTSSGIYACTSLNANGCVHTDSLYLKLNRDIPTDYSIVMEYDPIGCKGYKICTENNNACLKVHRVCWKHLQTALEIPHDTNKVPKCNSTLCVPNSVLNLLHTEHVFVVIDTCHKIIDTITETINPCPTKYNILTKKRGCDSYTWFGNTYTAGGTYTYANPDTCATLNLTINYSTSDTTTITACDSYTWSENGVTYTGSGIYTVTSLSTTSCGCVHTEVLNLTINSTYSVSSVSACDSYTWSCNGFTYTTSGSYTCTSLNVFGCVHTSILNLTINHSTSSSSIITACNSYTWSATGITYTASGTYNTSLLSSTGCDSSVTLVLQVADTCISMSAKVILSGAYNNASGLMYDSLRTGNYIPSSPAHFLNSYNGETIGAGVLSITGANAIVDWVFIELRSAANNNIVVATRHALVQRDGDIVNSADGISSLYFPVIGADSYYVAVKHRNHLGVMTASAIPLTSSGGLIDFTTAAAVWQKPGVLNAPRKLVGSGIYALWSGDANANKNVKYNGVSNDKEPILFTVGIITPNNTVYGYRKDDLNMDGKVKYANSDNDRAWLLSTLLNSSAIATPNEVLYQHTPN